jgi:hypothetical protein
MRRPILLLLTILAFAPTKLLTAAQSNPAGISDAQAELAAPVERLEQLLLEYQENVRRLSEEVRVLRASPAGTVEPTAGASIERPQAPAAERREEKNAVESVLPGVKLGGTVWLYSYNPFRVAGARSSFDLYGAWLNLDRESERFGFHVEYRVRTTRLRSFFPGPTWMEQAYVKTKAPGGVIKVGQIYKQLGIFSDGSFYGGLMYFDGLKYNPEWGASYEGKTALGKRASTDHYFQYFQTDSRINGSYPGRDVVSDPDSRRRNVVMVREVPRFKINDKIELAMGASGERGEVSRKFEADRNTYRRAVAEASLTVGNLKLFGEALRQTFDGPRFADLPRVTYTAAGGDYRFSSRVSAHFNYSQGNYDAPNRRKESILQPGVVIGLGRGYSLWAEYAYWRREGEERTKTIFDRSLNLVGSFTF